MPELPELEAPCGAAQVTERDWSGMPWALLASDRNGRLEFAGPAILSPPKAPRAAWRERMTSVIGSHRAPCKG